MAREIARSGASCRTRMDDEGRAEPRPDEHGVFDAVTAIAFLSSARPQCRARTDRSAQSHRTAGLEVLVSRHISAVDVLDSSMTAMRTNIIERLPAAAAHGDLCLARNREAWRTSRLRSAMGRVVLTRGEASIGTARALRRSAETSTRSTEL